MIRLRLDFGPRLTSLELAGNGQVVKNNQGYGSFLVDGRSRLAHRFSWWLANGPILEDMCILHKCDNPSCVNPSHLYPGTKKDNATDRKDRNRRIYEVGERHHRATLTDNKVREIRELKAVLTQKAIAEQYGVSDSVVSKIMTRKTWSHL